jgi:uncharacterized protein
MISYQDLLDEAMLGIVKKVLQHVQTHGLDNDQSFYISFCTDFPGVVLSKPVKAKYPKEITIVLQYQFRDLKVHDDKFTVNIAFGGVSETVAVPFHSLTSFVDPLENFSLQFRRILGPEFEDFETLEPQHEAMEPLALKRKTKQEAPNKKQKPGEVIALDQYRKNKKK